MHRGPPLADGAGDGGCPGPQDGEGLADARYCIRTYPVEVRGDSVWAKLPPLHAVAAAAHGRGKGAASGATEENACDRP